MKNFQKDMADLLDTSVHEVNDKRNIIESLKEYREKTKQPFFDGSRLPYAVKTEKNNK